MCNPDLSTEDEVMAGLAEFIRKPFDRDAVLTDVLDSLDLAGIVFDLEVCFDITIPVSELTHNSTVEDLIEIVKKVRGH